MPVINALFDFVQPFLRGAIDCTLINPRQETLTWEIPERAGVREDNVDLVAHSGQLCRHTRLNLVAGLFVREPAIAAPVAQRRRLFEPLELVHAIRATDGDAVLYAPVL